MKLVIISLLISFVLTPWQLIQKASDYSDFKSSHIKIAGENSAGESVTIEYVATSDLLTIVEDEAETVYQKDEIPIYYRLFFAPGIHTKRVDFIVKAFKKAGYKVEEKRMDRSKDRQKDLYVLGTDEKALFFSADNYQIYKITFPEGEVIFTDYHKSVRPLSFPGKIEIKTVDGIKEYSFIRKEFKPVSE